MTDFTIPDDLVDLLDDIARRENRPRNELIEKALRDYAMAMELEKSLIDETETRNLLLLIAQVADEYEGSKEGDIAERSRELLNNEFPEYLMRRMHGDYSDVEK